MVDRIGIAFQDSYQTSQTKKYNIPKKSKIIGIMYIMYIIENDLNIYIYI